MHSFPDFGRTTTAECSPKPRLRTLPRQNSAWLPTSTAILIFQVVFASTKLAQARALAKVVLLSRSLVALLGLVRRRVLLDVGGQVLSFPPGNIIPSGNTTTPNRFLQCYGGVANFTSDPAGRRAPPCSGRNLTETHEK